MSTMSIVHISKISHEFRRILEKLACIFGKKIVCLKNISRGINSYFGNHSSILPVFGENIP